MRIGLREKKKKYRNDVSSSEYGGYLTQVKKNQADIRSCIYKNCNAARFVALALYDVGHLNEDDLKASC